MGSPGQSALPQQLPVVLQQVVSAERLAVAHPAEGFGIEVSSDFPQLLILMDLRVDGGDCVLNALQSTEKVLVLLCAR